MSDRTRVWSEVVSLVALTILLALTAKMHPLRASDDDPMRVVFYGYVNRQPRTGTALIDGARLSQVTDLPLVRAGGELSPDGARLAFDSCAKPDRGIEVVRLDGTEASRVVATSGEYCVNVRWSRDGQRLSYPHPIDQQLHIVELATGIDTPLPYTSPAFGWHSWSPAGDAIVYETGRGGSRRIDIIDLLSWRTRPLVGKAQFGNCEVWAPDWSPTHGRIAFTSCDRKLYVVNADGTALTLLASSAYAPRWSQNGTHVLFLSGRELRRIPASGGTVERLGVLPYYGGPFSIGPSR